MENAARQTEVSRMMNDLEKGIANLEAVVLGLGERLGGVRSLKPTAPELKNGAEKLPSMCVLADGIRKNVIAIENITRKVVTITEEIEI